MDSVFPQGPGAAGPGGEKLKAYWNRPGGKFGIVVALGGLIAAGYYVLPILEKVVWNTLHFGIAVVCLGVFLFLITNKQLRLSAGYLYEILMRRLVGLVIQLDPFVIADTDIKDMEATREKIFTQTTAVETQKEALEAKIEERHKEYDKQRARAEAAQKNNMLPEVALATRQMTMLQEYVKQLVPIRDNLAKISEYLNKVYKNSGYLIEGAKSELELKKDLYKSVTAGNRALNTAMQLFKGDPQKKLMVEQSMEFLKNDIAGKLANMKQAIRYSSDVMRSIDLDNATFEQQGLDMLQSLDPDKDFRLVRWDDQPQNQAAAPGKVNTAYYDNLLGDDQPKAKLKA